MANWNSGQTPIAPVTGSGQVPPVGTQTLPTPRLPGAAGSGVTSGQHDTVILDRPSANVTVTLSSGTHNIRKLYMREAVTISGGSLNINYNPAYASDTVNYPNALRSGPLSAQFSGQVTLSGSGALSLHTLQVDAARTFTLSGGTLTLNRINLMPASGTPAKILLSGDVTLNPLANASAVIANGTGSGSSGFVDLGGGNRTMQVGNGTSQVDLTISVPISNGGLTKSGPGKLALTGANTYTGDTVVNSGILSLGNPFLANTADVYLTSGAILDLSFNGGPDIIDSLFIDGISQSAGIWGAVGSGAQFTTPWITGTGFLQVTTSQVTGDFDQDGDFDCADVDGLVAEIVAGTHTASFDLTGDALVNGADLAEWRALAGAANLPSGNPYLPGDATLDGVVDGLDFTIWNSSKFTSVAAWCAGDFSADGIVDGLDFTIWNSYKFMSADGATAVPEPTPLCLGALTIACLSVTARRVNR
jgi:autotransporter-associated beta strand protein